MKRLLLLIAIVALSMPAFAKPPTQFQIPGDTIAAAQARPTCRQGAIVQVDDAASKNDCTAGSGTTWNLCLCVDGPNNTWEATSSPAPAVAGEAEAIRSGAHPTNNEVRVQAGLIIFDGNADGVPDGTMGSNGLAFVTPGANLSAPGTVQGALVAATTPSAQLKVTPSAASDCRTVARYCVDGSVDPPERCINGVCSAFLQSIDDTSLPQTTAYTNVCTGGAPCTDLADFQAQVDARLGIQAVGAPVAVASMGTGNIMYAPQTPASQRTAETDNWPQGISQSGATNYLGMWFFPDSTVLVGWRATILVEQSTLRSCAISTNTWNTPQFGAGSDVQVNEDIDLVGGAETVIEHIYATPIEIGSDVVGYRWRNGATCTAGAGCTSCAGSSGNLIVVNFQPLGF